MISLVTSWARGLGSLAVCAALGGALGAQEPVTPPPVATGAPAEEGIASILPVPPAEGTRQEVVTARPATLVYWNRPIATFRAPIGSQDPAGRVAAALERLGAMSERTLRGDVRSRAGVVDAIEIALITVGDRLVFAYLPADVDPLASESFEQASAGTVARLSRALAARSEQRSLPLLLRGLGEAFLATAVLGLLLSLARRGRRWWTRRVVSERGRLARVRVFEIDLGHNLRRLVERAIAAALWLVGAFLLYTWLTFVLSRFPYTQPWGEALGGWLASTLTRFALAIVLAIPDLATIALIVLGARAFAGLARSLLDKVADGSVELSWMSAEVATGAKRIVVLAIWLFTVAIVYPFIPGSSTGAFQSVSVLAGLMFSVASAGLINHVMAGWVIVFSRSLRVGDFVKVGEVEGTVLDIGVLSTKILNRRREEVVLPNALVNGTATTNYSRYSGSGACIVSTAVTIGYDTPWRQVHAMLLLAAECTGGVRREPAPRVMQRALSDFYVEYELVVEVELRERARILSDLHSNIQDEFNRHGVQIMSPHFERQPADAVVVPADRWHAAPASGDDPEVAQTVGERGGASDAKPSHPAAGHSGAPPNPS